VIGLYEPGNSWLHRLGTGWKFLALMLVTTALSLTGSLYGQGAWLLFALALYPLAGLGLEAGLARVAGPAAVLCGDHRGAMGSGLLAGRRVDR